MLFKKSHIEFAIDCLAARGERFEGADSRGILPQHLIEFILENQENPVEKYFHGIFLLYGAIVQFGQDIRISLLKHQFKSGQHY